MSDKECPTCGREDFKSVMGMRSHHAQAHDESLRFVSVTCDCCGERFERQRSDVKKTDGTYCSNECYAEDSKVDKEVTLECEWCGDNFTDSLGKNYQTANYCSDSCRKSGFASKHEANTEVCLYCDSEFEAKPSHDRKYCSQECMGSHREMLFAGDSNPNHKGSVSVTCEYCSKEYEVKPSVEETTRFCSKPCYHNWMSENLTGEASPHWHGGYRSGYGPNWIEQRQKRLEKDDYECVVCGMSDEEHKEIRGVDLHVHHIERKESFRDENGDLNYERANRIENLITLCAKCHGRWEGIPLRPQ